MKIVKKIFNCLFLFSLSSFALSDVGSRYIEKIQFVSPQKETRDKSQDESFSLPLYFYSTLFSSIKSYEATSQRCSAYYRPSESELSELNNANKLLNDLSDCHKKTTGKLISENMVKEFLDSNPDTKMMNLFSNLSQLNRGGINPNSMQDMKMCSEKIYAISIVKIPFQQASGYPSQGWCEKLK